MNITVSIVPLCIVIIVFGIGAYYLIRSRFEERLIDGEQNLDMIKYRYEQAKLYRSHALTIFSCGMGFLIGYILFHLTN